MGRGTATAQPSWWRGAQRASPSVIRFANATSPFVLRKNGEELVQNITITARATSTISTTLDRANRMKRHITRLTVAWTSEWTTRSAT